MKQAKIKYNKGFNGHLKGDTGVMPYEKAKREAEAGKVEILEVPEDALVTTSKAEIEVKKDYGELRSKAAEISRETGEEPSDYTQETLEQFIKDHS